MREAIESLGRPVTGVSWPRLALTALVGWWTLRLALSADPWCFIDYANLAFHEAGHLFFAPLGVTLHVLGGSFGQCLVPIALGVWFFLRERRLLGSAFCLWWLGENLVNVARYMADARDLVLPLVGGGDHDWNELFFRFGLLTEPSVRSVSGATRFLGLVVMLAGVLACALLSFPGGARRLARRPLSGRR